MSNLLPTAAYLAPVLAFIASKPSNLMGLPLAMMMVIFVHMGVILYIWVSFLCT